LRVPAKPNLYTDCPLVYKSAAKMKSLSVALALVASAEAGLRFPCSTLTIQRLDPVVQPGQKPSSHVHHIVGGIAFNATMEGDVGERATCTTCQMSEGGLCSVYQWECARIDYDLQTSPTTGPLHCISRAPPMARITVFPCSPFNHCWAGRKAHKEASLSTTHSSTCLGTT
jgi:hypothetical protein